MPIYPLSFWNRKPWKQTALCDSYPIHFRSNTNHRHKDLHLDKILASQDTIPVCQDAPWLHLSRSPCIFLFCLNTFRFSSSAAISFSIFLVSNLNLDIHCSFAILRSSLLNSLKMVDEARLERAPLRRPGLFFPPKLFIEVIIYPTFAECASAIGSKVRSSCIAASLKRTKFNASRRS